MRAVASVFWHYSCVAASGNGEGLRNSHIKTSSSLARSSNPQTHAPPGPDLHRSRSLTCSSSVLITDPLQHRLKDKPEILLHDKLKNQPDP